MNVDEAEALLSIRHSRRERAEVALLGARHAFEAARAGLDAAERDLERLAARAAGLLLDEPSPDPDERVRSRLNRIQLSSRRLGAEARQDAARRQVADAKAAVERARAAFVPSRRREEAAELVLAALRREQISAELRADERRMAELIELRAAWRRM